MKSDKPKQNKLINSPAVTKYPSKSLRYFRIGWNTNQQQCYTDEDLSLLKQITAIYHDIIGDEKGELYFKIDTHTTWYDWWTCTTPRDHQATDQIDHMHSAASYTLPNRPAKDSKLFPLWTYGDSIAKLIANWQSDRIKNQYEGVMNDPVMLVLDELRNWFYYQLSEKECNAEVLAEITQRQSYLKNIIHTIPDFGPDRLRLHSLVASLTEASRMITDCIANKELPHLLSDLTISGKSLETTLASYLHFLLINEEVTDNFSKDMLEITNDDCHASPICKIYQAPSQPDNTAIATQLSRFSALTQFLHFTNEQQHADTLQAKAELTLAPLANIKFASFVTDADKTIYLNAVATLEALTTIRRTFEKFNSIQTKIGTYFFASSFIEQSTRLTEHYILLIEKANRLITQLIQTAESGHEELLRHSQAKYSNRLFEKNLRALETQFAKRTTVMNQLNEFSTLTVDHIQKYQYELKKLVAAIESGAASREVQVAMSDLYQQMDYLNQVIPALLDQNDITIQLIQPSIASSEDCPKLPAESSSLDIIPSHHGLEPSTQCSINELTMTEIPNQHYPWSIDFDETSQAPRFKFLLDQDNGQVLQVMLKTTLLSTEYHPHTNEPIYVYGINGDTTYGKIAFYGQPYLCVSPDKTQHNVIKASGFFSEFHLTDKQLADHDAICTQMPPSFISNAFSHISHSALHGVLRGGANVFGEKTQQPGFLRLLTTQAAYFASVFLTKLTYNTYQEYAADPNADTLNIVKSSATNALYDTAVVSAITTGVNLVGSSLEAAGDLLQKNDWTSAGAGLKRAGQIARYGFFAYSAASNVDASSVQNAAKAAAVAAASLTAGVVAEKTTELVVKRVMN